MIRRSIDLGLYSSDQVRPGKLSLRNRLGSPGALDIAIGNCEGLGDETATSLVVVPTTPTAAGGAGGEDGGGVQSPGGAGQGSGVVGHVWVSLKLRDPSMLLMRAVRQWNMARDEASEEHRRIAQVEAKR